MDDSHQSHGDIASGAGAVQAGAELQPGELVNLQSLERHKVKGRIQINLRLQLWSQRAAGVEVRSYGQAISRDAQVLQPGEPADDGGKIHQQTCEDLQRTNISSTTKCCRKWR